MAYQCRESHRRLKGRPRSASNHAEEPCRRGLCAKVTNEEVVNTAELRRRPAYVITPRPALSNGMPHSFDICRLDEQDVGSQYVPFEHREVQRIFKTQVEEKPHQQQWIAERTQPDQNSQREL